MMMMMMMMLVVVAAAVMVMWVERPRNGIIGGFMLIRATHGLRILALEAMSRIKRIKSLERTSLTPNHFIRYEHGPFRVIFLFQNRVPMFGVCLAPGGAENC